MMAAAWVDRGGSHHYFITGCDILHYKIYIRYALSGLVIEEKKFETKYAFYAYIGKLVLSSIEHIIRIDYQEL